jgi:hypothetical protein
LSEGSDIWRAACASFIGGRRAARGAWSRGSAIVACAPPVLSSSVPSL